MTMLTLEDPTNVTTEGHRNRVTRSADGKLLLITAGTGKPIPGLTHLVNAPIVCTYISMAVRSTDA